MMDKNDAQRFSEGKSLEQLRTASVPADAEKIQDEQGGLILFDDVSSLVYSSQSGIECFDFFETLRLKCESFEKGNRQANPAEEEFIRLYNK